MKIIVASQSQIKITAVEQALVALRIEAEVIGVKSKSGISEQPLNSETYKGARNRTYDARQNNPGADFYIAIENGLFQEGGEFVDRAVLFTINRDGQETTITSEGVIFPREHVLEASRRGFATTTAGQVMAERGVIEKADDPHETLAGRSRLSFLIPGIERLLRTAMFQKNPASVLKPQ